MSDREKRLERALRNLIPMTEKLLSHWPDRGTEPICILKKAREALANDDAGGGETCPVCEKGTLTRVECCLCDTCDATPVLTDQIRRNDERLAAPPQHRDAGDALREILSDEEAMLGVADRAAKRQEEMMSERREALEAFETYVALKGWATESEVRPYEGAVRRHLTAPPTVPDSFEFEDNVRRVAHFQYTVNKSPLEVAVRTAVQSALAQQNSAENKHSYAVPEAVRRLPDKLRERAIAGCPAEYADRGMAKRWALSEARDRARRRAWLYTADELDRAIAQHSEQHPDDSAVDRFAEAMKSKLKWEREERGRGGWDDPEQCSDSYLANLLVEHLRKGNPGTFEDVANFSMMLHQRGAIPTTLAEAANAQHSEPDPTPYHAPEQAVGNGRNPHYEGTFEDETEEQAQARRLTANNPKQVHREALEALDELDRKLLERAAYLLERNEAGLGWSRMEVVKAINTRLAAAPVLTPTRGEKDDG